MKISALVVALPVVLLACGSDSGDATNAGASTDLTGTSWILSSLDAADADVGPAVVGEAELTLTFGPDGQASGATGCNRFTARWVQDGRGLSITVGAVTQAACATDELQSQEAAYLRALGSVDSADATANALTLSAADASATLEFDAAISDLAGSAWEATGINNQTGGVESTALTSSVTAEFSENGLVTGFSGCRDYTGTYETDGEALSIADVTLDGPDCEGDVSALEADYVAALANAATFSIEGSTLNLRDTGGATQVNYSLRR